MAIGLDRFWRLIAIPEIGPAIVIDSSIKNLDIGFTIDCSWKRDPDTANIKIYNAQKDTRSYLETNAKVIQLYAGRTFPPTLIFQGEVHDANSYRDDEFTDWITEIDAEDTSEDFRVSPVSISFAEGMTVSACVAGVCAAAGVVPDVLITDETLTSPLSFLTPGRKAIQTICRRYGLRYQMQKGKCVVRNADIPLNMFDVPILSEMTGLIGVPSVRRENKKTKITFRHMLEPRLIAGNLCKLMTASFSRKDLNGSAYFLERVTHNSDGDDQFDTECECRVYQ